VKFHIFSPVLYKFQDIEGKNELPALGRFFFKNKKKRNQTTRGLEVYHL